MLAEIETKPVEIEHGIVRSIIVKGYRDAAGEFFTRKEINENVVINNRNLKAFERGLIVSIFLILPAFVDSDDERVSKIQNAAGSLFIMLGAYIGYKKGMKVDVQKAIERIKEKREKKI